MIRKNIPFLIVSLIYLTGFVFAVATVQVSTVVLQATCVDAAVIPFLENRLNFCYGCYGCRDATDIQGGEAVLGFPVSLLPAIAEHLAFLGQKAIPASRTKKAFADLERRLSGGDASCGRAAG